MRVSLAKGKSAAQKMKRERFLSELEKVIVPSDHEVRRRALEVRSDMP